MPKPKAVVLLSGGLDSTTVLAIAIAEGFSPYALSFSYGQRHSPELQAAQRIADRLQVSEHKIVSLDLRAFGGSALTDVIAVPKHRTTDEIGEGIADRVSEPILHATIREQVNHPVSSHDLAQFCDPFRDPGLQEFVCRRPEVFMHEDSLVSLKKKKKTKKIKGDY